MSATLPVSLDTPAESLQDLTPPEPKGDGDAVERDTQERGRRLLAAIRREEGRVSPTEWLYGQVMGLSTRNETLKVELFRFVDALPALQTPEAVSTHLSEYLLRPDVPLPRPAASLLRLLSGSHSMRGLLSRSTHLGAQMMARRFIAGRDAREALGAITRLRREPMTFTLDLLGEAVTSEADAIAYQKQYLDIIADLSERVKHWPSVPQLETAPWGQVPRVNVSLKLSSLYSRFDPLAADATVAAVKERLYPLLRLARERGVFVNFDREQYDFCHIAGRIFRNVFCEPEFRDWPDVGIVVQAYLRNALDDLRDLRDWAVSRGTPITVRLVKGAYWDFETILSAQRGHRVPVWQSKADTDRCFEDCTQFLIENRAWLRPAIASHNVRSVARAQALASAQGLPRGTVEYQVLFGMGEPMGRALARQGERVRVYVPFGELLPGMAYLVRRLLENSSNDGFIRQAGSRSGDNRLLAAPVASAPKPQNPVTSFTNEPETDWVEPDAQERMRQTVAQVGSKLGATVPVVVAGQVRTGGTPTPRPCPSELARIASLTHYASLQDVSDALASAQAAFPRWRDTPVVERAALLRRVADEFNRRRFEIASWMVWEVGKPWREADADVAEAIDFCRYYAGDMERLARGQKRNVPGEWNEYRYDARGPAVIIAPWNFPLAILTGMAVAALVAGNPVVLKPAEQSPRIGYFLMEALQAAGCPPDVAHFLPGDGEQIGPALVSDPRVALIAFTGSRNVGLSIIEAAAKVHPGQREIKKVIAELGGKNAIIVDEDADLDEATVGIVQSVTGFAGQKCSACSRVIVIGDAYEGLCRRLAQSLQSVRIGPAHDPATDLGPIVDQDSQQRIARYRQIGMNEGMLLAEQPVPDALNGTGYYVPALAFTDCPPEGRMCQEEIFGPVVAILRARDLTHALELADNTPYALTGGFYSRSPRNIERVRDEYRVGNLYINRKITGALVDRQPFGGARMSGVGSKAGGPDYLLQFLVPRTITESVMRRGFAPSEEASAEGI